MTGRQGFRWALALATVAILALGWRYPVVGFAVPVVMLVGMVGGLLGGRWVCGNLCPRGAFFDRVVAVFARNRPVPQALRGLGFRWALFAGLMGFLAFRVSADPGNWRHWGTVFWQMCAITTGIGLIGSFVTNARFWCAICPIGTFGNAVGGAKGQLTIDGSGCKSCGCCDNACPMHLPVAAHCPDGVIAERDCIRCGACAAACPGDHIRAA